MQTWSTLVNLYECTIEYMRMFVGKRAIVWYMFEDCTISSSKVTFEIVEVISIKYIVDWNGVGFE